jgi:hypothetical protein
LSNTGSGRHVLDKDGLAGFNRLAELPLARFITGHQTDAFGHALMGGELQVGVVLIAQIDPRRVEIEDFQHLLHGSSEHRVDVQGFAGDPGDRVERRQFLRFGGGLGIQRRVLHGDPDLVRHRRQQTLFMRLDSARLLAHEHQHPPGLELGGNRQRRQELDLGILENLAVAKLGISRVALDIFADEAFAAVGHSANDALAALKAA